MASTAQQPAGWLGAKVVALSAKVARRCVRTLNKGGDGVSRSLEDIPNRMHLVARQTRLLLELIEDFRRGRYREVPWSTVAVASAGVLYTVSPADLVPDALPFLGALDDMAVIAVATRFIRGDLERYCRFKGYPAEEYFRNAGDRDRDDSPRPG
jgi:uncharacterized membrane protein YkvA (DUF1232 family)